MLWVKRIDPKSGQEFSVRDPDRIPRILEKIRFFWDIHPDMRIGQLIENAKAVSEHEGIDTFSAEDDKIEAGLDTLIELFEIRTTLEDN